jgi:hypothetical protein
MGEYQRIADRLAGILEEGTIDLGDSRGIAGHIVGRDEDSFNLYPSGVPGRCHDLAVIISLTYKVNASKKGQLGFRDAIDKIDWHLDRCPNTRSVVFVTDNWDARVIKLWRRRLQKIQHDGKLEIYLIVPGNVNEIAL